MSIQLYTFQLLPGGYEIVDGQKRRVAKCYSEDDAKLIVAALNFLKGVMNGEKLRRIEGNGGGNSEQ